jgi:hypothetical protein
MGRGFLDALHGKESGLDVDTLSGEYMEYELRGNG